MGFATDRLDTIETSLGVSKYGDDFVFASSYNSSVCLTFSDCKFHAIWCDVLNGLVNFLKTYGVNPKFRASNIARMTPRQHGTCSLQIGRFQSISRDEVVYV